MNKVIMIGNLTRDPEAGETQSGVAYCRFSIAVNRRFSKDEEQIADFFNVTSWRGLAETCSKHLKKGKKFCVIGSIQTHQYEAQDGSKRTSYDIIADDVEFLSSSTSKTAGDKVDGANNGELKPVDTDDLPF